MCTDARIIAVLRAGKDAPLTGNVARQDCILKDVERVAELAARDHLQNEATKRGREKDAKDKKLLDALEKERSSLLAATDEILPKLGTHGYVSAAERFLTAIDALVAKLPAVVLFYIEQVLLI